MTEVLRTKRHNHGKVRLFATFALASGALAGCAGESTDGKIVAGVPGNVVRHAWVTDVPQGNVSSHGYELHLVTEECPGEAKPAPGPTVAPRCQTVDHITDPKSYLEFPEGSYLIWDSKHPYKVSEVQSRPATGNIYSSDEPLYDLKLEIKQCRDDYGCADGFVSVSVATWIDAEDGEIIGFKGNSDRVISD